ncbi:MAG: right-handed parallel beta-helix repeat-containing protein, partial [Gammaproteobacteria bacterium]|nr:right-handed parallel beta-helix repeat-containing protein [Gammaproteobacteria bacterium]
SSGTISNNHIHDNGTRGIYLTNSSPTISGNTIEANNYAIEVRSQSNPVINGGNRIMNNSRGLHIYGTRNALTDPKPIVNDNSIYDNTSYNYYAYYFKDPQTINLNAQNNWWGSTDIQTITTKIYDNNDNSNYSPYVDYSQFLTSETDDGSGNGNEQYIGGLIDVDTILQNGITYTLLSNITVQNGKTLTIEPGAILKFSNNMKLEINGKIDAQGTSENPIRFTSVNEFPEVNDWGGIEINDSTEISNFKYAIIEYATKGLSVNNSSINISDSEIHHNGYGLYLTDASGNINNNHIHDNTNNAGIYLENSSPLITGNLIELNYFGINLKKLSTPLINGGNKIINNGTGIYIYGSGSILNDPKPIVNNNSIYGNTSKDYYASAYGDHQQTILNAQNNWWGVTDIESIKSKIYDINNNPGGAPYVDFSHFLMSEGGAVANGEFITGEITEDTSFYKNVEYQITHSLIVPEGKTLTLEAGAHLKFSKDMKLIVNGDLNVQGTVDDPVRFSSTNSYPMVNDWSGIEINNNTTTTIFEHVIVEYATKGISVNNSSIDISDSEIHHNGYGLYLTDASGNINNNHIHDNTNNAGIYLENSSPLITGNLIDLNYFGINLKKLSKPLINGGNKIINNGTGIYIYGSGSVLNDPKPIVNNNSIYGNTSKNYYAFAYGDPQKTILNAQNNWWGATDIETIKTKIYDINDYPSFSPYVDFSHFLMSENGTVASGEFITGEITEDTSLYKNVEYQITHSLIVPEGKTLTLEPGTHLKFSKGMKLVVNGDLNVQGTTDDPIRFSSANPYPEVNDWLGIEINNNTTTTVFEHIIVEYATKGISVNNSSIGISDSEIHHNGYGLYLKDASGNIINNHIHQNNNNSGIYLNNSSPMIMGNIIESNQYGINIATKSDPVINNGNTITDNVIGLYVYGENDELKDPKPIVNNNSIYNNSSQNYYAYGFQNSKNNTLNARNNWWGATDIETVSNKVYEYFDNTTASPYVDYGYFLTAENGSIANGVFIGGEIDEDTTLQSGVVYRLISNLTVQNDKTLTIEPGAQFKISGNMKFIIDGSINASGTEDEPIVFSSDNLIPEYNDWAGIELSNSVTPSILKHVKIQYANKGVSISDAVLEIDNSEISNCNYGLYYLNGLGNISQSNIHDNSSMGIYLTKSSPLISGNTITNNPIGIKVLNQSNPLINNGNKITNNDKGIYVYGIGDKQNDPKPVVNYNSIYNNTNSNMYSINFADTMNTTLNAKNNWWGTTEILSIAAEIYDYEDNPGSAPYIDFSHFLNDEEGDVVNGEFIGGQITENMTLYSGTDYYVTSSLIVQDDATLTIEPGVELKFSKGMSVIVDGQIDAQGTANAPIRFTSESTSPQTEDWLGIKITNNTKPSILKYVQVEYAKTGIQVNDSRLDISYSEINHNTNGLEFINAEGSVLHNKFHHNNNYALSLMNTTLPITSNIFESGNHGIIVNESSNPIITLNKINANKVNGILVKGLSNIATDPKPVINNNSIYDNPAGIRVSNFGDQLNTVIDARNNWWGTRDTVEISLRVIDYHDYPLYSPKLDFSGYLHSENGLESTDLILSSPITQDLTLTQDTSYLVPYDLIVPVGVTLTIEKNVTLKMNTDKKIIIEGGLIVNGSSSGKVRFTSAQSSVNRSAQNDWRGIYVKPTAHVLEVNHALIEYAYHGLDIDGVDGVIQNSLFMSNASGLFLHNGASSQILNNVITDNQTGITLYRYAYNTSNPNPIIRMNDIYSNIGQNLTITGTTSTVPFTIEQNWWGETDVAAIRSTINANNQENIVLLDNIATSLYSQITPQNVSYSAHSFKPVFGETVSVNFYIGTPATVSLLIYPEAGGDIVAEVNETVNSAGNYSLIWDGKGFDGNYLPDDAYHFELYATDGSTEGYYKRSKLQKNTHTLSNIADLGAHKNDFYKINMSTQYAGRISVTDYSTVPYDQLIYKAVGVGDYNLLWDFRDKYGRLYGITTRTVEVLFLALKNDTIVIESVAPTIIGTGTAPNVEIKSDPYRVVHSYNQISKVAYQLDQDANVTVKLIKPCLTTDLDCTVSFDDPTAITLVDDELLTAKNGSVTNIHEFEWRGYDFNAAQPDPHQILVDEEGTYTYMIRATSAASGRSTTYRGTLQLYQ